jgi:hypothetical protein
MLGSFFFKKEEAGVIFSRFFTEQWVCRPPRIVSGKGDV